MPDRDDHTLRLAREGATSSDANLLAKAAAGGAAGRLNGGGVVALVEDGDVDAAAFRRVFSEFGDVTCFGSGERALAALCSDAPAAGELAMLIVDMGLPGIDGPRVIETVRALKGGSVPAIFGLSAVSDPVMIERAFRAGADDYFVKPKSLAGLRGLVADLVELTNETAGKRG